MNVLATFQAMKVAFGKQKGIQLWLHDVFLVFGNSH